MSGNMTLIVAIFMVVAVVGAISESSKDKGKGGRRNGPPPARPGAYTDLEVPPKGETLKPGVFRTRELMTANEMEFYGRLRAALPEHQIFPQIAMSALIDPVASGKAGYADFLRVAQKRIDYGVFTPDFELVAIIELEDRSHNRQKDEIRDALVASMGSPEAPPRPSRPTPEIRCACRSHPPRSRSAYPPGRPIIARRPACVRARVSASAAWLARHRH